MSLDRRISDLEAAAVRQGYDALRRRLDARLRTKSGEELHAIATALDQYLRSGEAAPGLIEILQELTQP
jgi:hypothetical protein